MSAKRDTKTKKTGKPGRPAFKESASVRSEPVKVRFTEAEKEAIRKEGEKIGLGLSPFIRMVVITYLQNQDLTA